MGFGYVLTDALIFKITDVSKRNGPAHFSRRFDAVLPFPAGITSHQID